jgi:hypothetical protein
MLIRENHFDIIRRTGRKACLLLVSCLLVTLVRAQCPGCALFYNPNNYYTPFNTVTGYIDDDDDNNNDNNYTGQWGFNPWGVNRADTRTDLRFSENGGKFPNNDGGIIAGYRIFVHAATWCPVYNDKLFYYDPARNFTRQFTFPVYPVTRVSEMHPPATRYSLLGIIYSTTGTLNQPCTPNSLTITPTLADTGDTRRVTMVLYGHENAASFCGEYYHQYSSFSYTVEAPKWTSKTKEFMSLCQDVDRNFNLADYFSVSGVSFNLDFAGDTVWQFPGFPDYSHDYQLNNTLYTLRYPRILIPGPDGGKEGSHWEYDYSAIPDTTWRYPTFPNYSREYQLNNNMFTANPTYITQFNPHELSPGVHTILAMKTYDNGVYDERFSSHRGVVQFPLTITVLPGAPKVSSVSFNPTCVGVPSGSITVTGVSGNSGNYRYILRNGLNNVDLCDPEKLSCFNVAASGSFSGGSYTISGLKDGAYTLWIANGGDSTGACAFTKNVTIGKLSQMDTLPINIQHISCPGGNNGLINITDTGGLTPYTFTLTSSGVSLNNTNGRFSSLKAGTYTMVTKDGCEQTIQRTIKLTEPFPVTIRAAVSATDCNTPANGTIDVTATGGSGIFDYYLYDEAGKTIAQKTASAAATWSIPALPAGTFIVAVKNTTASGCTATTDTVVVAGPPAISISYVGQTNNKCSGDALGSVRFSGSGGQANGYLFYLQNTATGQVQQSTTGNFSQLPAALYKAWVRNRDISCLDSAIYASSITITAPPALQASADSTDITCNGKGDGILHSGITGGTPGYNLQWQQWNEPTVSWLPLNGKTTATVIDMQKGTYRLLATDQNNCSAFSNSVLINEPAALLITGVNYTDIVCYGGTGSIQTSVSGGNGNYINEYSTDNGNNWRSFTAATGLVAASYKLRARDAKGCTITHANNVTITAPAIPLAISYQLTDYNGYNVPCHGSTNGLVTLSASGGNGNNYAGYAFAFDNGAFSAANSITTRAGNHNFSVKDARGCIVNTAAALTEPAAQIQATVSNKHDNDCAGGRAGEVTVSATGGTPKYTFSIDGTNYQSSPVFSGLVSGAYQVAARDMNDCASNVNVSVVDLNLPITNAATIKNVSCYNGNNGSITLALQGGVPLYNYIWRNSATAGNVLNGLQAGNYYVTIGDTKGCTVSDSFTVKQPLGALSATTYTRPVCSNNPYGNILFNAQGGTPPYAYSIDGGTRFTSDVKFSNVLAGNYGVKVMDANGCEWTGTSTVATNSINPTLNFLVSTRQNALDTLQVKEVCIPKPDSIQWMFDARTMVIANNMFDLLIRYNQQGNYPVAMRAWYSGCDFMSSKVITINPYDPGVVNNYNNLFGIDTVIVSPNPSNGNFKLQVKLYRNQHLFIKIFTVTGSLLWSKRWDYTNEVQESISLPSNTGNGLVFIKLLTDDDARDVPVLITK